MDLPRIDHLKVQNYRSLKDFELKDLTPLTVFLGPNGSGKSTVFDIFSFVSEAFQTGLRGAWEKRGKFQEMRTHGSDQPIVIDFSFRENAEAPVTTYHLKIDERDGSPFVEEEWVQWRGTRYGAGFKFIDLKRGMAMSRARLDIKDNRPPDQISPSDVLTLSVLSQFPKLPRVVALRQFIKSWHFSHMAKSLTFKTDNGPEQRLSDSADNLANVILFLKQTQPWVLDKIFQVLAHRLQDAEHIDPQTIRDLQQRLKAKDGAEPKEILQAVQSQDKLKMLSYVTLMHDPNPLELITIEEPENHLELKLLPELASECRTAGINTHIMISTHTAQLANALKPRELWILHKDSSGRTRAKRAADMPFIDAYLNDGSLLGDLWAKGFFDVAHPDALELKPTPTE